MARADKWLTTSAHSQGGVPTYSINVTGRHVWGPLWLVEEEVFYMDSLAVDPSGEVCYYNCRWYRLGERRWARKVQQVVTTGLDRLETRVGHAIEQ